MTNIIIIVLAALTVIAITDNLIMRRRVRKFRRRNSVLREKNRQLARENYDLFYRTYKSQFNKSLKVINNEQ